MRCCFAVYGYRRAGRLPSQRRARTFHLWKLVRCLGVWWGTWESLLLGFGGGVRIVLWGELRR